MTEVFQDYENLVEFLIYLSSGPPLPRISTATLLD